MDKNAWLLVGLMGLSLSGFGPTLAAEKGLTARDFARVSTYQDMELSPTGRYLAVVQRDQKGGQSLLVFQLPERKVVSGMKFSRERTVSALYWVSNERMLIAMGYQDEPTESPGRTGELFGVNADGSGKEYLFGYSGRSEAGTRIKRGNESKEGAAFVIDPLPEVEDYALVKVLTTVRASAGGLMLLDNYTPLSRLNVKTGKLTALMNAPVLTPVSYFADRQGRPRLVAGYNEDSSQLQSFWREDQGDWQRVAIKGLRVSPLQLSADGRRAYFRVEKSGSLSCLVELAIPAKDRTEGKELVCKAPDELWKVYYNRDRIPFGYQGKYTQPIKIIGSEQAPGWAGVLASLQAQFTGLDVRLISLSLNEQRALFGVFGDRNAGDYLLYDSATQEAALLDSARIWQDPARMSEVRTINYKARDGQNIEAFLTLPAGLPPKQLPLVVLPHGGPIGVADEWGWDADAQFLASRGYAVLQPNFRGSAGYGEAFRLAGYRQWGGLMIDDITDGARWTIANGFADPGRICIAGASYGGYAAVMSAIREPDLYRCAVGYAGVYDLNRLLAESDGSFRRHGKLFWEETIAEDAASRAQQSPINFVERLRAPILIVHGGWDTRAPPSQAEALRSALKKHSKTFEWYYEAEEGHGFFDEDHRAAYYEKLEAFLGKHLRTP